METIRKLAIAFIGLNVLDAGLTHMLVSNGGYELNPLMRIVLGGPAWVFWYFKVSLALIFALALLILAAQFSRQINRIFIVLVIGMGGICGFNGIGLLC